MVPTAASYPPSPVAKSGHQIIRVAVVRWDIGMGGAERLIVYEACQLTVHG